MYILKDKETNNYTVVAEKQKLANLLGIHRNTLNNRLELNKTIESEKYLLIIPFKYYPPTKNKGNRDSLRIKKAKSEGEIAKKGK
jgi:hypothetical protein